MELNGGHAVLISVALILGAALGWLVAAVRSRKRGESELGRTHANEEILKTKNQELESARKELSDIRNRLSKEIETRSAAEALAARANGAEETSKKLIQENTDLKAQAAKLTTQLEESEKGFQEKVSILNEAEKKLSVAFAGVSAEVLRKNNDSFLQLAKTTFDGMMATTNTEISGKQKAIEELVKPLRITLETIEKTRESSYASLSEQIRALAESSKDLKTETTRLVQALKTPSIRGRWGEVQLRRVVEFTGMVKYCDFLEQESTTNDEGGILRPDMIVKLPSKRAVIIDAKVPLQAFLEALETDNEDLKREKLKNHALQVRTHIEKLSRKEYWSQFEDVPEFVFAFIPGESIYSSALQQDPSLIEFGVGKNVILATPTSLITLLRVVAQGWREAQLAESAKEISAQGSLIYDRLSVFANHFTALKRTIEKSVETFNSATSSLETRVLPAARKMKELGLSSTSEIPQIEQIDKTARSLQTSEPLGR